MLLPSAAEFVGVKSTPEDLPLRTVHQNIRVLHDHTGLSMCPQLPALRLAIGSMVLLQLVASTGLSIPTLLTAFRSPTTYAVFQYLL